MTARRTTSLLAGILAPALLSLPAQKNDLTAGIPAAKGESFVTLEGSRPALEVAESGRAADESTVLRMRIVFARSAEQQAALDRFEAEILDRNSANYRKWTTPVQFGTLYGPVDADVEAVVAWLQSHGFTVDAVPPGRIDLSFSGTVHQAEEAFHTSIHFYEAAGQRFFAPVIDPVIPASLKGTIAGVTGLIPFRATPVHEAGPMVTYDPGLKGWESAATQNAMIDGGLTNRGSYLAVTPADAATIYDAPNVVLNANATSGPTYTGRGVTIGVIGDAAIRASTIADYRARFLGDSSVPVITDIDGVSATKDADQSYIDVELAGALAPGASIHLYTATDLFSAIERALSDDSVDILTLGFNACANAYGAAERRLVQEWWAQAAAQGIAVTVPSRIGSSACHGSDSETNLFATTAYNLAIGGTDTRALANGFSEYVNASMRRGSFYRSARSYIPEAAWSDAPPTGEPPSGMQTTGTSIAVGGYAGLSGWEGCAEAGIPKSCINAAKPAWQRGHGVPTDGIREVPDVALFAGNGAYGSGWAVCTDDEAPAGSTPDCTVQPDGRLSVHTFGGAGTATPAFAGILALVQEKKGGRLGQAAKELYGLYNGPNSARIFHHISARESISSIGSDARAGYDRETGLGSVDAAELVRYWGSAVGTGAATVTVTPSLTTVSSVAGFTVAVTVSGTLGNPTGTVVLQSGSFSSGTQALSAGSFTFHIAPGAIAVGNDTLTVAYSGDSNYATATGTATVTVTQTTPTVNVAPSTHTLNSNATLNVVATVAGGGGVAATGTVTLSGGGYTSTAQTLTNGASTFAIPAFSLAAGADVLTVSYAGDSLYAAASGSTTVTVTKSAFTLTATDLTVTAGATANNASHVTVTPAGSYTGTVTLTAAVTSSPTNAVSTPTLTGGAVTITSGPATGFITVATTALPAARRGPLAQSRGWYGAAGSTAIAAFLFWILPGRARRWRAGLLAALVCISAGLVAIGCGGGSKKMPTVTVTPGQASIRASDALSVAVKVAGTGSVTATGTVTLTSGSFSTSGSLSGGTTTLSIPANTLAAGKSNTLTANYSGDAHYLTATGSATVSVAAPGLLRAPIPSP